MTKLLERMREELVRRNYAANTIDSYLRIVNDFQQYTEKPLTRVGPDDLRQYHAYLLEERKLAVRTVVQRVAAIRFLYCKTLKRRDMKEDLPYPRNYRRQLPVVLSPEEVGMAHRLRPKPLPPCPDHDSVFVRAATDGGSTAEGQRY